MEKNYRKCMSCDWIGDKEELQKVLHLRPLSYRMGCPVCYGTKLITMEKPMNIDVEEIVAFKDSNGKIHATEEGAIKANQSIDFNNWYGENDKIITGYGSRGTHSYASSDAVFEWLINNREYILNLLSYKV